MQISSSASHSAQDHGDIPMVSTSARTGKQGRIGRHTLIHLPVEKYIANEAKSFSTGEKKPHNAYRLVNSVQD